MAGDWEKLARLLEQSSPAIIDGQLSFEIASDEGPEAGPQGEDELVDRPPERSASGERGGNQEARVSDPSSGAMTAREIVDELLARKKGKT